MKKIISVLVIIALTTLGIYIFMGINPPKPTVKAEGQTIEVGQGSHCWDKFIHQRCVDMIAPPDLIAHYNMKPVVMSPESEITISYWSNPIENSMSITQWNSDGDLESVPLKDATFILPKEPGNYIYSLSANWDRGSSGHVFVVEVK